MVAPATVAAMSAILPLLMLPFGNDCLLFALSKAASLYIRIPPLFESSNRNTFIEPRVAIWYERSAQNVAFRNRCLDIQAFF
jgi:hypothetical protein